MDLPNCPECGSAYTYQNGHLYICPECAHEWIEKEEVKVEEDQIEQETVVRDAYGNELNDGDSVSIVKDLKVNGASDVLKRGTTVKDIQLVNGDHDIDCKIKGFGAMQLKSEFVKKL